MSKNLVRLEYAGESPRHFRVVGGVQPGAVVSVATELAAGLLCTGYFKESTAPQDVAECHEPIAAAEKKGR